MSIKILPTIISIVLTLLLSSLKISAHESFVSIPLEQECGEVQDLPYYNRCDFVKQTHACKKNINYIDYLQFIHCSVGYLGEHYYILGVILIGIWCLYLFLILETTADRFFCPALAVVSKVFKFSEHLAGVTLLAFGNGCADILTSLSDKADDDTELMYNELFGAAAFVSGFIAGAIILIKPFRIPKENYLRDVVFFIVSITWIKFSIRDEQFNIVEAIGTILIYLAYLIVVLIQHIRLRRKANEIRRESLINSSVILSKKSISILVQSEIQLHERKHSSADIIEDFELNLIESVDGANKDLFSTFLKSLNPINMEEWQEAGVLGKSKMIIEAPVVFFLLFFIPIIDYGEELCGWSKLLNILHIFSLPGLIFIVFNYYGLEEIGSFPVYGIIYSTSAFVALLVFFTSRNDCPPRYHKIFAIGSFIGSILVVYILAEEVVSVLSAFGVITNLTHSMLGLSILAWGNSVGDLFSNITLAKQGYQQMAFAACFGGPMLNVLIGLGVSYFTGTTKNSSQFAFTRPGALGSNTTIYLLLILIFPMFALAFTRFYARRSIGIIMIVMYSMYIFTAILCEMEVIHPYGTDHDSERSN